MPKDLLPHLLDPSVLNCGGIGIRDFGKTIISALKFLTFPVPLLTTFLKKSLHSTLITYLVIPDSTTCLTALFFAQ